MTFKKKYFFIDEGGDSAFYGKRKKPLFGAPGFQPLLNLGMITIDDKQAMRKAITGFQKSILDDPLYNTIHSVSQPNWYLHARGDHPDIKAKFVDFLRNLEGFKTYIILGRKRISTFNNKHNNKEREFYFDMLYHLLKDRMNKEDEVYHVFLSARDKSTQQYLQESIQKAIDRDNSMRKKPITVLYKFDIVRSQDTPELSIIDYMLWALQRYILKGEVRFFKALEAKYSLIVDLYDFANYGSNYYHKKNPFTLDKATAFQSDGYP